MVSIFVGVSIRMIQSPVAIPKEDLWEGNVNKLLPDFPPFESYGVLNFWSLFTWVYVMYICMYDKAPLTSQDRTRTTFT
jgi:hypothetical protein